MKKTEFSLYVSSPLFFLLQQTEEKEKCWQEEKEKARQKVQGEAAQVTFQVLGAT